MDGLDGCGKSDPNGIRSLDRRARSESLYRLSYRGPRQLVSGETYFGYYENCWVRLKDVAFEKLVMSPLDVITTADTSEHTQCCIRRKFVFRMCTSVCYTMDRASACVCLTNSWRLALCLSFTVPLKKRGTSPSDAKLWPTAYIVTVWRHCTAKTSVCSAPHSGTSADKEPQKTLHKICPHSHNSVQLFLCPVLWARE